jgi:hypothetical protein
LTKFFQKFSDIGAKGLGSRLKKFLGALTDLYRKPERFGGVKNDLCQTKSLGDKSLIERVSP